MSPQFIVEKAICAAYITERPDYSQAVLKLLRRETGFQEEMDRIDEALSLSEQQSGFSHGPQQSSKGTLV